MPIGGSGSAPSFANHAIAEDLDLDLDLAGTCRGGTTPTTPHPLLDYDLYASPISDMGPDHFCCMGSGPGLMSEVGLVWSLLHS